jgi:putative transposase
VKYAYLARQQARRAHPVRLMCRVLGVAPSGFYAWRRRAPSARARADATLLGLVRHVYAASRATYGAPRVHAELLATGHHVGRKRVARVMRRAGLRGRGPTRRRVRTTQSQHAHPVAPNHVARQFAVAACPGVDRVWVSDLTYVPTGEGWLYLAVILDLASRRVVGWAMRDTLAGELALDALAMALATRRPAPGLVHHSDRGVHYAATEYQACLAAHGVVASMSRKGDCWDNAVAESFFATLEHECIARAAWPTRAEARHALFDYIETWYNPRRRHSTLGYRSPAEYEGLLIPAA